MGQCHFLSPYKWCIINAICWWVKWFVGVDLLEYVAFHNSFLFIQFVVLFCDNYLVCPGICSVHHYDVDCSLYNTCKFSNTLLSCTSIELPWTSFNDSSVSQIVSLHIIFIPSDLVLPIKIIPYLFVMISKTIRSHVISTWYCTYIGMLVSIQKYV